MLGLLYWEDDPPPLPHNREKSAFAVRADAMSTDELLDQIHRGFEFSQLSTDDLEYCVDLVLRNGGLTRLSRDEIRRRLGAGQLYAACLDPRIERDGLWVTKVLVPRGTCYRYSAFDHDTSVEILMSLVFQDQTIVWAYYHRSPEYELAPKGTLFKYEDGQCRVMTGY